jgi:signal transduction histidine kinase/CheY-like chemotaxis protein
MTDRRTVTPTNATPAGPGANRSSLRTRLRLYAILGTLIVGGWLYYTINAVLSLYDSTVQISRFTDLHERVTDAIGALQDASASLDRYAREGQGYDLAQHNLGRTTVKSSLGAIRRQPLAESVQSGIRRADAAEEVWEAAAERVIAERGNSPPGEPFAMRDNQEGPAATRLRDILSELETSFGRGESIAEARLKGNRDAATSALIILAALILAGLTWLLADVNRRILAPCTAASHALRELVAGRKPPRLPDSARDEVGELGSHFNEASRLYTERGQTLEARDIDASVNAVLAAATTINDLAGFGARLMDKVLEVTQASSAVLYVADGEGDFKPAAAIGGSPGRSDAIGREEARRAAREGRPILVSVEAQTPTVDLFDGRILPRESLHVPLMYFGQAAGVLALGAATPFTPRARNILNAITPSLAVALANASANERLAGQSRRLAEQNVLLEEQRSRIANTATELQRASALKDRFLAAVSHELRTPMTVILGFTGTLLRGTQGELNPQQRESLERVQRNARLLLGLINDVLDISKIESGKAEVHREVVSVLTLLQQVQKDYEHTARQKGVELRVVVSPELDTIIGDSAKLTQIAANLIGNALKFTPSGFVEVRAEPRGLARWALVVTDSGIGIPAAEHDAIFEEFRQGETLDHQGHGGTGLGLAIVRKLAVLMGGSVTLQSAPGQGSTFTVTLPRELTDRAPAPAAARLPAARPSNGRRVLVVDDDESSRKLLRFELEPLGAEVEEAESGKAAIAMSRERPPEAIILDVLMPGMDGWTTLRALKEDERTRAIPVFIHSVVDNRAFGFSLGASDYLVKPLPPGRLLEALTRVGVLGSSGPVLIVDDDPDVRRLLEEELSAAGFPHASVPGGAQALDVAARERPSAILLDLMMPEPDGFEVLYRIRENADLNGVPVIVLTAKDLTPGDFERLNGSVQRIIRKGADMTRLVRDVLGTIGVAKLPEGTSPWRAS